MNIGGRRTDLPGWTPVALVIGGGTLLFLVRDILPPFIVGAVLAYLLIPVVTWIERYFRLSRLGAALLLALVTLSPLSAIWFWVIPPLVRDTQALSAALPVTAAAVFEQFFGNSTAQIGVAIPAQEAAQFASDLGRRLLGAPAEPAAAARAALGFYANGFLAVVILAYVLMDGERLVRSALNFVAPEQRLRVRLVAKQVDRAVLPYIWGLILLSTLTLSVVWLAFGALYGLPYALPVALTTTLLGLVPFIGPLVAAMFAALVALGHGSFELAVAVIVFYYLYRLIERQLVAPRLLDGTAVPHPVLIIFATLAGAALAGLFGALLAIPLAAGLKVLLVGWQAAGTEQGEETTTQITLDAR